MSYTELLSSYLDEVLQPSVQELPNYVKDMTTVLCKIDPLRLNTPEHLSFPMDVLCVIPHSDGHQALKHILNKGTTLLTPFFA